MDIQNPNFLSIAEVKDRYLNQNQNQTKPVAEVTESFNDILRRKTELGATRELRFSKHAAGRLTDRNISLSEEQLGRLQSATQKALQKGIKESLVIMDSLAFIVNIPNNTVVTAIDKAEANENVFTNIDGAVII